MIHSMNNQESRAVTKSGAIRAPIRALSAALAAAVAAACLVTAPTVSSAADAKKQEISRAIAKEMTAAQKALQAQQWQEALKNLEAADQKSGLTPVDKRSIHDYEGYAVHSLEQLQDGPAGVRGRARDRCVLPRRGGQDHPHVVPAGCAESAIREGDRIRQAGVGFGRGDGRRSRRDGAALLPAEGLQGLGRVGGQGDRGGEKGRRGAEGEPVPVQAPVRLGCGRYRRRWTAF